MTGAAPVGTAAAARGPLLRGIADALPIAVGYVPFGLVLGASIGQAGVPALAGWLSSALLFAGAAQLAAIDLLDAGASAFVVVLTVLVINARHVMYSGAIASHFATSSRRTRWAAAYLLADPVYTMAAVRFGDYADPGDKRRYYAGLGVSLWTAWQLLTGAGVLFGAQLPADWPLDLAIPLTFLALLVPTVTDRAAVAAAGTGGIVAVVASAAPLHSGLLLGALAGIAAGVAVDRPGHTPTAEG